MCQLLPVNAILSQQSSMCEAMRLYTARSRSSDDMACRSVMESSRSSSTSALAVPRTRLRTIGDRTFPIAAARTWNSLPPEVTSSRTLSSFKSKLKTYLFKLSFRHSDSVKWLRCCCNMHLKFYIISHHIISRYWPRESSRTHFQVFGLGLESLTDNYSSAAWSSINLQLG